MYGEFSITRIYNFDGVINGEIEVSYTISIIFLLLIDTAAAFKAAKKAKNIPNNRVIYIILRFHKFENI